MAGRPQNRLELRRQYEAAEPVDPMEDEAEDVSDDSGDDEESERKPKKKAKAPSKAKAKVPKAPKPSARMRIVWTVINDAFKPVGTFEFNQREAAEARAAELTAKGKGNHFIQKTKEPMPDNAPGIGAALPRPEPTAVAAEPIATTKTKAKAKDLDDEEIEDDDDDAEADVDADADDDDDE